MAETKKPVVKSEATKAADTKTTTAATPVEAPAAKKEPVEEKAKTEEKETGAKKPGAKKPGRKPGAKKPGRKPAAAKKDAEVKTTTTRKTAVKESVHLEFADKTYTPEQLVQSAKDIWKYDLHGKVGDFKSVELYVKPEESVVYYVINGDVKGQFPI